MTNEDRLRLLIRLASLAYAAGAVVAVMNFARTRRPSDAITAAADTAVMVIGLWVASAARRPYLWDVDQPSNVRSISRQSAS